MLTLLARQLQDLLVTLLRESHGIIGGVRLKLFLREGRVEILIAVLVGHECKVIHANGYRLLADAEEAADIDDNRVDLAVSRYDNIADLAEIGIVRAIDGGALQRICAELVSRNLGESRLVDGRRSR